MKITERVARVFFLMPLLSVAVAVVMGSALVAAQASEIVTACVNQSGKLRVVESQVDCKRTETPVSWSLTGSVGAQVMPPPDIDSGWTPYTVNELLFGFTECSDILPSGDFLVDIKFRCPTSDGSEIIISWLHPGWGYDVEQLAWWYVVGDCLNVYFAADMGSCDYRVNVWSYEAP